MITKGQYIRFDRLCRRLYEDSKQSHEVIDDNFETEDFNLNMVLGISCDASSRRPIYEIKTYIPSLDADDGKLYHFSTSVFTSYVYNETDKCIDLCNDSHETCVMTLESF